MREPARYAPVEAAGGGTGVKSVIASSSLDVAVLRRQARAQHVVGRGHDLERQTRPVRVDDARRRRYIASPGSQHDVVEQQRDQHAGSSG